MLVGDLVYQTFTQRPYPAGLTYSGHPLACAAAVGAIRAMHDEGTVAAAARLGTDVLEPGLTALAEAHPTVGDVRGIGGPWTVELVRDRGTKEPLVPVGATGEANAPMTAFAKACLDRGLVPLVLGNRVHVAPPLNVSDSDAADGLAILDEALVTVDALLGEPSVYLAPPLTALAFDAVSRSTPEIAIIGATLDLGQGRRGVDMGPSAIRYAGTRGAPGRSRLRRARRGERRDGRRRGDGAP